MGRFGYDSGYDVHVYGNYHYRPWEDVEEDNVKIFHDVYFISDVLEEKFDIPLSPYSHPSFQLFKNWIDMGKPDRKTLGGQQYSDHEKYYEKWVVEQLEKELEL